MSPNPSVSTAESFANSEMKNHVVTTTATRTASVSSQQSADAGIRGRRKSVVITSTDGSKRLLDEYRNTSLAASVVEAEWHLWALSASLFIAVVSTCRKQYLMALNVLLTAPVFICATCVLSGWVALFVSIGYLFCLPDSSREPDDEWLKRARTTPPFSPTKTGGSTNGAAGLFTRSFSFDQQCGM